MKIRNITLSLVNAVIFILIALVNYSKLESTACNLNQMHSEYDKMMVGMDFFYNRLMECELPKGVMECEMKGELPKGDLDIQRKHDEVEISIQSLKTYFNVMIPREIKRLYPILSHLNIFAFIKNMEDDRNQLINEYYELKNELKYILYRQRSTSSATEINRQNKRVNNLLKKKELIKKKLLDHKSALTKMEELVMQEIKYAEKTTTYLYFLNPCKCMYNNGIKSKEVNNAVIEEYLRLLGK